MQLHRLIWSYLVIIIISDFFFSSRSMYILNVSSGYLHNGLSFRNFLLYKITLDLKLNLSDITRLTHILERKRSKVYRHLHSTIIFLENFKF